MKISSLYIIALLFLTSFVVYGATVFADYGFRDDYSLTREAHEEVGKVLGFTASHGRPLYGIFLEISFGHIKSVADLAWLRLASVTLLSLFGLLLYRQLRAGGWEAFDATAFALTFLYLPASQVTISWAVGWPWGISLMLALLGFQLIEASWRNAGAARHWRILGAVVAYILATSIYQSNTLFAVVLMAAMLLASQPKVHKTEVLPWFTYHLALLFVSLLLSYSVLQLFFIAGVFHESGRLQFENQFVSKLTWFLTQPLPSSVAFLTLRDDFNTGVIYFRALIVVITSLIAWAIYKQGRQNYLNWLLCLLILPWVAHVISLVAAERALGYRTMFALSNLMLVMTFVALREVATQKVRRVVLVLVVLISGFLAHEQTLHLIAEPQEREWRMIKDAVANIDPAKPISIYLIEPKPADRSTARVYRDEFGSFTSNSEWAPTEMFKAALHERFPKELPSHGVYDFEHGGEPPPATDHYDQIIDVRTLKKWREPN